MHSKIVYFYLHSVITHCCNLFIDERIVCGIVYIDSENNN